MKTNIKLLTVTAKVPTYATDGSGCFDLYADLQNIDSYIRVSVGTPARIQTNVAFEVPEGYVMLAFSRSGHGINTNVRLANCVGVIDSDFRGGVTVKLTRDEVDGGDFVVKHGDRIAQAMIIPVEQVEFVVSTSLTETARGAGGFGSTGT